MKKPTYPKRKKRIKKEDTFDDLIYHDVIDDDHDLRDDHDEEMAINEEDDIDLVENALDTEPIIEEEVEVEAAPKKRGKAAADKTKFYVDPKEFDAEIMNYYDTGKMSDNLANMVSKISHKLSYAPNFINYCVDKETEILTDDGWKKHDDPIGNTSKILSYNPETKQLVWSKILDMFHGDYDGLMFKLTNIGLDALVTPNHKFVSLENGIKPIEEFKTNEHMILMGNPVEDPVQLKYTDNFVELVGWAVTEGNFLYGKTKHCVQIFQKEGKKAQKIRNLLLSMQLEYKEYDWSNPNIKCFRLKHEISNEIIKVGHYKILSMDFIRNLSQKQRILLVETMISGDGWNRKNKKNKTRWSYCQKNKEHIDSFVALCTFAGLTTSTTLVKNIFGFTKSPYYVVNIFQEPKLYCNVEKINMYGGRAKAGGNRMNGNIKNNTPTIPYKGIIWCPQTEYGTFVCRRGKYVYVTGNTYREEMVGDGVIRMMKALMAKKYNRDKGTNPFSYFTRIAFNAFRNRIKKEKHMAETHDKYSNEILMMSQNYNVLMKNNNIRINKERERN